MNTEGLRAVSDCTPSMSEALDALYATAHWLLAADRNQDALVAFRAMTAAAPRDERGWVGLSACHQSLGQPAIALELASMGCVAAYPAPRCELARARLLVVKCRDDATAAFERALDVSILNGDESLAASVRLEMQEVST